MPGLAPAGTLPAAQALHLLFRPQVLQNAPDHIHAYIRALILNLGDAERARFPVNGPKDQVRLFAFGDIDLAEALFEFLICGLDDEEEVIEIGPGVVFALVTAAGALFQGFIVPFLVLLDEALQADVAAHLEPQVVALQEQQKPRDAPVTVAKWMNAKEIQVEGRQEYGGRDDALPEGFMVDIQQNPHAGRCSRGADRLEADPRAPVGKFLDYVAVLIFVFSGVPDLAAGQAMELQNGLLRNREMYALLMDQGQGLPVSPDFLFIPIAQQRLAENDGGDAGLIDDNTLDAVG